MDCPLVILKDSKMVSLIDYLMIFHWDQNIKFYWATYLDLRLELRLALLKDLNMEIFMVHPIETILWYKVDFIPKLNRDVDIRFVLTNKFVCVITHWENKIK